MNGATSEFGTNRTTRNVRNSVASVDQRGPLADEERPAAVGKESCLLCSTLNWNVSHRRPAYRLTDRGCVGHVVFLTADIRLHVGRLTPNCFAATANSDSL